MGSCSKCILSGKMVKGVGPIPARVMLVGEAPGYEEDKAGVPFVGKTGRELDYLLARNGVQRDDCYITNLIKCRPPENRDPSAEEIRQCSGWLDKEIAEVQPYFIITVGRISTRHFLGDVTMDHVHGLPYLRGPYIIIPTYHPALGLHVPERMLDVQGDFEAAGAYITGKRPIHTPVDAHPDPEYYEATSNLHIYTELHSTNVVAIDTEWARGKPWCLSYSSHPGTAKVIMADNEWCSKELGRYVEQSGVITVIHNALYDLPVLAQMGIYPSNVVDTMVMAYLLCVEPQGLKTLSYRHLGMEMQDYLEVIAPATHDNAVLYLLSVADRQWPAVDKIEIWTKDKSGASVRKFKQPKNIQKKAARILLDVVTKGANPWERWHNIELEEGRGMVESALGAMIMGDLSDIDRTTAIKYSARDADATLRLYSILWPRIISSGLEDVFHADMGMLPMVVDMMRTGIMVDNAHLQSLSVYFKECMDRERKDCLSKLSAMGIVLEDFNPYSWQQVGNVLYDRIGLKSKSRSTDNEILATMLESGVLTPPQKDVIGSIQSYRSYSKLKGTYSDTLPTMVDVNNRIHTSFRTTRTTTGRLCVDPETLIEMPRDMEKYPDGVPLKEVKVGDWVYSFDWNRELCIKRVKWVGSTKKSRTVIVKYRAMDGPELSIIVSPDHLIRTLRGEWIHAGRLQTGDRLMCMVNRSNHGQGYYSLYPHSKNRSNGKRGGGKVKEHRFIYAQTHDRDYRLGKAVIHHKDKKKANNHPDNLLWLKSHGEHQREHAYTMEEYSIAIETGVGRRGKSLSAETIETYKRRRSRLLLQQVEPSNHYVLSVDPGPVMQLWDMEVEDTHCFIGNEVALHNSSAEPNLQNQPSKGEEAKKIKDAFIAAPGCVLVECDYSQIELRVLAHMSQDANMMGIFRDGLDLHAKTASDAFDIPMEAVEGWQRRAAKTLNFGIAYGMQSEGLQAALATMGITRSAEECDDFIVRYFRVFPNVEKYMESVYEEAKRYGYVTDMFGRRRYIPHARSKDKRMQAKALREAGNHPIQSGAQGIIKRAMGRLMPQIIEWRLMGGVVNPLLQIHDSILLEISDIYTAAIVPNILHIMSTVVPLTIPTPVDAKVGYGEPSRWGSMEKWKGELD